MARNILDLLRQTAVPTGSASQALTDIGRVRETGKTLEETGPRRGSTIEEAQQAELQRQRGELLGEASARETLRKEQTSQEELQRESQRTGFRQDISAKNQKLELMSNEILDNLERNKRVMNQSQQELALETAAAAQRLASEKYMYELEDTGRRLRLESNFGQKEAMQKSIFDSELTALKDDFAFNTLLEMDDADFQKALQAFDNQTKLLIMGDQIEAAKELASADVKFAEMLNQIDIESMIKIAESGATGAAIQGLFSAGGTILSTSATSYMDKSKNVE